MAQLPELNPKQLIAASHDFGPMMVRAGAGTGKTTVLTRRIHRLVSEGICRPEEILALTFTNAAAEEMQDKLASESLLGSAGQKIEAKTFHSYCHRVLKASSDFELLSTEDLWVYFRQRLPELQLNYFSKASDPATFLRALISFYDRCSDELVDSTQYEKYVEDLVANPNHSLPPVGLKKSNEPEPAREVTIERYREIARVFAKAEEMMARDKIGSFGSLIVRTARLFQQDSDAVREHRKRARFILVDEFQDTNHAQLVILRQLAGENGNIFVVGDPDQAIYRFRGASSGAFEDFKREFPHTKSVSLADNQRSVQSVLDCAWHVIRQNPDRSEIDSDFARTPLRSARMQRDETLKSEPVELIHYADIAEEAQEIATAISERVKTPGTNYSDFAVLYRSHAGASLMAQEFAARGIPVDITGTNLMETDCGRDLRAILQCLVSEDDNIRLFRVAMMSRFRVPPEEVRSRLVSAKRGGARIAEVLGQFEDGRRFLREFRELRAKTQPDGPACGVIERAIRVFGFEGTLEAKYLLRFAAEWMEKPCIGARAGADQLSDFLDYFEWWTRAGGVLKAEDRDVLNARLQKTDAPNAVQMMTVHAAKGLEFKHVFVVRVQSNSFPTNYREQLFEFPQALRKSQLESSSNPDHYEEERRLFYVAVTRAKDTLALLGKQNGKQPLPSKYMRELGSVAALEGQLVVRPAKPYTAVSIAAGASEAWYDLPPAEGSRSLRLSASTIERYKNCPKQYYFMQEWGLPSEPGLITKYGSSLHNALRSLFRPEHPEPLLTQKELVALFEADFGQFVTSTEDQHHFNLLMKQGCEFLNGFYQRNITEAGSVPNVKGLEEQFSFQVDDVTVHGRMDRVDITPANNLVVLDYKTGKARSEEEAEKSLQLSIYALAAAEKWGMAVEQVGFYNLETNQAVLAERAKKDLDGVRETIREVAADIRAGKFEPKRKDTGVCRWCDFRSLCPATTETLPSLEVSQPLTN